MKSSYHPFRHVPYLLLPLFFLAITAYHPPKPQNQGWHYLFNGKNMDGWDTYIGPVYDSVLGKPTGEALGLNVDPHRVFSLVKDGDNQNLIRISGQDFGAITSKQSFSDYHLHLQFKWGKIIWPQKKGKKRDSGLLYHSVGRQGADYGNWMRSQEFQIEEGNCGDYWGVAGGFEEIPSDQISDSQYVYNPLGKMRVFGAQTKTGRHCIKKGDAENPTGEWNSVDLYCHGDTSVQVMNGKIMMVLYHSQQYDDGNTSKLVEGKIQIQSEGAEVFYKDIKIRPIKNLNEVLH